MMSKELLSHSLLSSYRDFLGSPSQNGELKKELMHLATNPEMFLPDEIAAHLESFSFMEELSKRNKLLCHIDGSVTITYPESVKRITGAGAGYTIFSEEETLKKKRLSLPVQYKDEEMTSHIAEYLALLACLKELSLTAVSPEKLDIEIRTDSEVLYKQMSLFSRTRNLRHQELKNEAFEYIHLFHSVTFFKIPRDKNGIADSLAREAYKE